MSGPHEDSVGVFVPRWAMEATNGDARDAMVYAQITWWLQPSQRSSGRRSSQIVERDGMCWLYMTDDDLAEQLGMSADQVYRARRSLKRRGLIESQPRHVAGQKVTLTRAVGEDEQTATSRFTQPGANRDFAVSKPRSRGKQTATSRNAPYIESLEELRNLPPEADVAPPVAVLVVDPLRPVAHTLTVLAFEQPVKPDLANGRAFPAAMGLIERVLHQGHPPEDVERAIRTGVAVWTLAGLQTALARAQPPPSARERRGAREAEAVRALWEQIDAQEVAT